MLYIYILYIILYIYVLYVRHISASVSIDMNKCPNYQINWWFCFYSNDERFRWDVLNEATPMQTGPHTLLIHQIQNALQLFLLT